VSRVELFERIRRDHEREELSIRALADRHGVHRRTVRQALASATPPPRKVPERDRPAMGPYEDLVRGWLHADREAPKKQRHTARRVWQRLVEEEGAGVAESTVRDFVRQVKAELAGEQLPSVPITGPPPCSRTPWMTGCPYGTRQRETTTKAAPEVLGRVQA
jgi:transposase